MAAGFGGGATIQIGVAALNNPQEIKGFGWQVSGFAAAVEGIGFDWFGTYVDYGGFLKSLGTTYGVFGGFGASLAVEVTMTAYKGMLDFSQLPKEIQVLVKKYLHENPCP